MGLALLRHDDLFFLRTWAELVKKITNFVSGFRKFGIHMCGCCDYFSRNVGS